ncbi:protein of unknown function [Trichlorobacter ammonificans]|uniref:Uncharacterized protein n=1 Tax=Trichlorobacter ammonificans TaxID=2916410 RepID=A0ABM9D6C7_9BACT|nr:protein of unknown function [Trichlorobacter ammonificans]
MFQSTPALWDGRFVKSVVVIFVH